MASVLEVWPMIFSEWMNGTNNMVHMHTKDYQPWLCSIIGAIIVGFAGVFPIAFLPSTNSSKCKDKLSKVNILQLLLSFAVGGLLADVFLHLLPEAWATAIEGGAKPSDAFRDVGFCVLSGIFVFIIVEMMASQGKENADHINNNKISECHDKKHVAGYLNLIANGIDNFTHGLAVAGSFLVSYKTGLLTTAAILIHEIPHEIGDFAILMKSGFTRWGAAKAQFYTAAVGLIGALVALYLDTSHSLGNIQVYVLGFTSGGFLNIALVTVLPDLLQENRPKHSAAQVVFMLLGAATMSFVAIFC